MTRRESDHARHVPPVSRHRSGFVAPLPARAWASSVRGNIVYAVVPIPRTCVGINVSEPPNSRCCSLSQHARGYLVFFRAGDTNMEPLPACAWVSDGQLPTQRRQATTPRTRVGINAYCSCRLLPLSLSPHARGYQDEANDFLKIALPLPARAWVSTASPVRPGALDHRHCGEPTHAPAESGRTNAGWTRCGRARGDAVSALAQPRRRELHAVDGAGGPGVQRHVGASSAGLRH